jgi:excisionase family DNA binding protein
VNLAEARQSQVAALTILQTAQLLQVDVRTVSRACEEGQLPHLRIGRRLLIPRLPLLALLGADQAPSLSASASQAHAGVVATHGRTTAAHSGVFSELATESVLNR